MDKTLDWSERCETLRKRTAHVLVRGQIQGCYSVSCGKEHPGAQINQPLFKSKKGYGKQPNFF